MSASKIEWTGHTWNITTGCTRVSAGCDNCYAATMSRRLAAMGQEKYQGVNGKGHFNGHVKLHEDALDEPLRRRKPTTYFVCSMSDLFHPSVPFEFIDRVFAVMALCPQHTFQVLTKRPERMAQYRPSCALCGDAATWFVETPAGCVCRPDDRWQFLCDQHAVKDGVIDAKGVRWQRLPLPNVWLGTSAENQDVAEMRCYYLQRCPAAVQFLSCEPLLSQIEIPYPWLAYKGTRQWVIAGGESGPGARPMHPAWVRSLRDQCQAASVPFFFKQWGNWRPPQNEAYDTANGRAGKPPAFIVGNDGTVHCFMSPHIQNGQVMLHVGKKAGGRKLDGETWDRMPTVERTQR